DVEVRYATFGAATVERARLLRSLLSARVASIPMTDLRRAANESRTGKELVRLALALDASDADLINAIGQVLHRDDFSARRYALFAASLSRASELRPVLMALLEHSRDDVERKLATVALSALA